MMESEDRTVGIRLIREGKFEEGCIAMIGAQGNVGTFDRIVVNEENVHIAKELVSLLCTADQIKYAEKIVRKCPDALVPQLELANVVDRFIELRRFEMASRAISTFGLLDSGQLDLMRRFLSALVTKAQYRLAVDWARKLDEWETKNQVELPVHLRWTPSALVSAMVVAEHYDQALKFIHELNLRNEYPVQDLIGHMLARSEFKNALEHIKRFALEPFFPPLQLMNGMLDSKHWETAVRFANEVPGLWEHFPKTYLVERMISASDWAAATMYIKQFGIVRAKLNPGEAPSPVLVNFIRALIAAAELFKAMKYVLKFELQKTFPPEKLIQNMIDMKQHQHALRYMKLLNLEDAFENQQTRIKEDRVALLRDFRGSRKIRAESARMRRGVIGASSYSPGTFHDLGMGADTKVCEKLWHVSPKLYVPQIPRLEDEVELSVKPNKMVHSQPQQKWQKDQNYHYHHEQMQRQHRLQQQQEYQVPLQQQNQHNSPSNFLTEASNDHQGEEDEEIILLGSGSSLFGQEQGNQSNPAQRSNFVEQLPEGVRYQGLQSQAPIDFLEQLRPTFAGPNHFQDYSKQPQQQQQQGLSPPLEQQQIHKPVMSNPLLNYSQPQASPWATQQAPISRTQEHADGAQAWGLSVANQVIASVRSQGSPDFNASVAPQANPQPPFMHPLHPPPPPPPHQFNNMEQSRLIAPFEGLHLNESGNYPQHPTMGQQPLMKPMPAGVRQGQHMDEQQQPALIPPQIRRKKNNIR